MPSRFVGGHADGRETHVDPEDALALGAVPWVEDCIVGDPLAGVDLYRLGADGDYHHCAERLNATQSTGTHDA